MDRDSIQPTLSHSAIIQSDYRCYAKMYSWLSDITSNARFCVMGVFKCYPVLTMNYGRLLWFSIHILKQSSSQVHTDGLNFSKDNPHLNLKLEEFFFPIPITHTLIINTFPCSIVRELFGVSIVGPFPVAVTNLLDLKKL